MFGFLLFYFLFLLFCNLNRGSAIDINQEELLATGIIEWKCETNFDCQYVVNGTSCINGFCECPAGFVYNGIMTSCIKVATFYGEGCEESIQCSRYLFTGGICMNAICVCSEGYYYKHGRCNAYSGLFGECQKNDDCYVKGDFEATSCVKGVCKCSDGYYQREHRTCRHAAKAVDDKCVLDNDCQQFDKTAAKCNYDNQCVVSKLNNPTSRFLYNKNEDADENSGNKIEISVGSNCTKNEDCAILGNAICELTGSCGCKRANYYDEYYGKCVAELGEPCNPKDNVTIDYSECRNGIWSCERHKVASSDNRKCDKVIRKYKDGCMRDIQCYAFGPDAICVNQTCVCNENSRFMETENFCWTKRGIGEKCVENVDCFVDGMETKLSCLDRICSCPSGTHANSNRTECVSVAAEIGEKCETNNDCLTNDSKCIKGVCACKENYYASNNNCIAGIGANCTTNEDCGPENSECFEFNKCSCTKDYVNVSTSSCIPAAHFGAACEEDIQCHSLTPGAICAKLHPNLITNSTTNSICSCAQGHHYKYDRCFERKVLGEKCTNLGECYVKTGGRAVCRNSRCACDWNYSQRDQITCDKSQGDSIKASVKTLIPIIFMLFKYSL